MSEIRNLSRATAIAQTAYRQATSLGQILETTDSFRPAAIDFEAAANAGVPDSLTQLTQSLFHDRLNGSRFLSSAEWTALSRTQPSSPNFAPLMQCRILREPWQAGTPQQHSKIVLLDARTLQLPHMNGTKHHALALARAFARALPSNHELAFFTTPRLPALAPEISSMATLGWRPSMIGDVEVFVQLATVVDPNDPTNLDLLKAPWIRRISVFLDDIQGLNPAHFIGSHAHFWEHQVTIEKIRSSDVVLTLGQTSNAEAISLWDSLDTGESKPTFVVTSCQSGLSHIAKAPPKSRTNDFVVFGNRFPHKNVALVAAASQLIHDVTSEGPSIAFVAAVNKVQEDEIRSLAADAGYGASTRLLSFESNLTGDALSERIGRSRGVIVPSLHEGFSLPVVEAIERDVPVALSRIPAHQELLPEGPWFFDPRSVDSLVSVVREMGDNADSWSAAQRAALAERYFPSQLPDAVREALNSQTNDGPLRDARPASSRESSPARPVARGSSASAKKVSVDQLRERDKHVITTLPARPQASGAVDAGTRTLSSVKHEHDALVAEFHRSTTWRAGRIVTAPIRWFRALRGTKS